MDLIVRPLQMPGDGHALLALVTAHAAFERGAVDADGLLDRIETLIEHERLRVWIAELDGESVGYATMTQDVATWTGRAFAHLDCLFVVASARSHGIGAVLLQAVATEAQRLGVAELQWQTPEWNTRAIAFYRRTGAEGRAKIRFTMDLSGGQISPVSESLVILPEPPVVD